LIKNTIIGVLLLAFLSSPFAAAAEDPDALYREGRFSEAEKAYARSDMDRPKDIRYRYNRGCAAYQNGDFQGAKAAFSSVLRRTEDEEIRFRSAYNLGNAAFKEGDFESAIEQYKEALMLNPESEDAKHNLELALREREKQKSKERKAKEKEGQKDSNPSEDDRDSSKSEKKREDLDKQHSESKDQEKGKGREEPEKQKNAEQGKQETPVQRQPAESESLKDLSGELSPLQAMPEQDEKQAPEEPSASLDRKKAEALLDNLKEDRSRFLQFQFPGDKRAAPSGKDW
jgi:Ca-activated chloride channel family protein